MAVIQVLGAWALTLTCLRRGKGTGMLVEKLEFNP